MGKQLLIDEAKKMLNHSYSPYSKFPVGAALLAKSGKIYGGCNIENAAYPSSCCAERVAIFHAISKGEKEFIEMAIIGHTEQPITPCGACRQVMSEFFSSTMKIHMASTNGQLQTKTMNELLPLNFKSSDIN